MQFDDVIKGRRSIRGYQQQAVSKDTIREVTTGTDQDGKAIPKVTTTLKRIN